MRLPPHEPWKRWQHGLVQSLLQYHGREDHATVRVLLLACIGTVGMPLYYVIWQHFFPQEYESLPLRLVGILLCALGLFARQFSRQMLNLYLLVALSYIFPFFFTFMFLMNHASGVWSESLLIGLVVLFHFDTGLALRAYAIGTALACVAAVAMGAGDMLSSRAALQQLPIHWFTIAVLSVAKISRHVLAQEKLAGMGAGLATVAHELRTPLTSVDANVRGLLRKMADAQGQSAEDRLTIIDALARIQFEVRHMNHMIDLFLLSATAVRQNLRPVETVSMETVVEAVLKRYPFVSTKQQKMVKLEMRHNFQFAGQTELAVVVLLNLLRNALRAVQRAGKGRVRIVIDGGHQPPRLLFIDTGCGIAASQLSMIFQRFYSHPPHNGAGIGLALCKEIMDAWRAHIRCVSRESAYAIFILEFPLR
ncbi:MULTISPECIES: HAMP domain-containing sensor histidine kinase [unclassified Duganella]|uniref:sensor histidine kinase n=1 Tax=unclassified Duganella TaxID=2636909 RepID=UPI0008879359|nr:MULTISPECIES: HAMP domain-containing sensor histidine kinase [unclassified Duganella]SDG01189.1 two-component system, CAI-1 autoinducer sensor kinase/phosphatase CqsS [Duganella sp. OV458]SDJ03927.1 two-component system, CAI-1 autoinducer sensor kinase/phosphatase CqsS [Duganella sp. OV510]